MRLRIKDFAIKVGSGVTPKGGASVYQDNGIPLFRSQNVTNDGFLLDDIAYISEEIHKSMIGTRLMPNDVLLNITGASIGRCYYLPKNFKEGNVNQHVCIIRPKGNVLPAFLYYNLISAKGQHMIDLCQTGANREGLTKENICNFEFDIPPIETQQRMVTYLDTKLSEIHHQVSLLTSKRDAYLRLKKSIINHAVTRGLNPNVKIKDSGIEWIGEVPEHWEVKRMKDICKLSPTIKPYEQYLYCSYLPMEGLRLDNLETSEELVSKLQGKYTPFENGDLLIAKVTPCFENGNIAIAKGLTNGFGFGSSEIFVIRQNKNSCTRFLFYMTLSTMFQDKACATMCGVGGLKRISPLFMKSHTIAIPPLPEQHAIATYLDDKCAKIDTIVSNLNKQISRYADLKRSLIDEVITGKRAV